MHESFAGFAMPAEDEVRHAADLLRMLSDPTRIKILWALLQGESSVACLAELVGATPTAVSQHLSKLRLAGYVQNRREATFIYYTIENPAIRPILDHLLADHAPADHAPAAAGARPGATPSLP
ncbi:metalloregulator ArsR/SmtB family transcription factor [uncultured Pseudonocardia sp.]|uniref:ArsR/SmtB family transcription factor n=1 Tax=uncultured Pseudonocardia sp. TaxID=211455 RepID=UPI00260844C1|nr:metalloregulator ArsR/SmtB family transcription factor [uncultured Pseudonocardia sp.]